MRSHIAALVVAVAVSQPVQAAQRVTVAPLQLAKDLGGADLSMEIEEAVRVGLLRAAPNFDLRVMSRATFDRMLGEARDQGRTILLTVPGKTSEHDAALARVLGTELVVSSKLARIDGRALLLIKLMRTADDSVLGVAAIDDEALGGVLARTAAEAERLARTSLATAAPLAAPPVASSAPGDRAVVSGSMGAPVTVVIGGVASRSGPRNTRPSGPGIYEDALPYCRSNLDCDGVGNWCRDRGDGIKLCMSQSGRAGDYCVSGLDCGQGLFCKERGDSLKVCMGSNSGRRGDSCHSSLDCGGGTWCKDRGDGMKVCM